MRAFMSGTALLVKLNRSCIKPAAGSENCITHEVVEATSPPDTESTALSSLRQRQSQRLLLGLQSSKSDILSAPGTRLREGWSRLTCEQSSRSLRCGLSRMRGRLRGVPLDCQTRCNFGQAYAKTSHSLVGKPIRCKRISAQNRRMPFVPKRIRSDEIQRWRMVSRHSRAAYMVATMTKSTYKARIII